MRNTIIITSILFVAVVVASIFYFSDLNKSDQSKRKPLTHIPEDAIFLTSFRNDVVLDDIFTGFDLFKAILGDDHFQRLRYIQDTILRHEQLAHYAGGQEIVLSFHPGQTQLHYLMVLPTTEPLPVQALFDAVYRIHPDFRPQWIDALSKELFLLHLPNDTPPLYVAEREGVLLASFSVALISDAINDDKPKLPAEAITHFRSVNRENSPLTWYINHDRLFDFATMLMRNKPGDFIQLLEGLSGYSALRMNFKSDAFMFSGSSTLDIDTPNYLSLYSHQQPIEQTLKNIFPINTASYMSFGVSDFTSLHNGIVQLLTARKEIGQMQEQHRLIQQSSGLAVQEELLPEWSDEFAVLELTNRENLAIIKIKDSLSFANVIQQVSTAYPENSYRLNHSNLLYYSFGDPLKSFTRPYFLLMDEYFICANNISTLRQFEADYTARKTLSATLGYIDFDALQANRSNVALFVNTENAANIIARGLKAPFETSYRDTVRFGYQRFYGWSFQLSGASGVFFSNFYAKYIDQEAAGFAAEWTFDLNGRLLTQPTICRYNDTSQFVLAQDASFILHAIAANGQKLWNARLPGPVLGQIHQLADNSIVLTTAERLYRFDSDGDPLPGFSLPLPHQATYGVTVREEGNDIRLFVPAKNRILAYDGRGKTLRGWENKTLTGDILFDVKTAEVGAIHFLIAATDAGRFYFFNSNGNLVYSKETGPKIGFQNPLALYAMPDHPEESWVATTDTSGTLSIITFEQNLSNKTVGQWASAHTFDAVNVTDNSVPELVFTNSGQLSVYRYQDGGLVYHYDFGQHIAGRPQFFRLPNGTHQIGITTEGNGLIYVFNTDGTLANGFPTEGSPHFYYGKLHNNNRSYLLCSKNDRKLYCYRF